MVIWLRNAQAEGAGAGPGPGVGIDGDVLRSEQLATIVDIDGAYAEMRRQCEEALAAARAQAQGIVDGAQAHAGELLTRAEQQYMSAAERGYDDGFEQGLTDWHQRAVEAHADAGKLKRVQHDRLAELVALAVEEIVATEDPKALFARAAATVERIVADGSPIQLRVHPSDVAAANAAFQEAAAGWRDAGRSVRLHVSADAALEPGACVAETDLGAVDASLSLHLAAMRGALERAVQSVAIDCVTDSGDEATRPERGDEHDYREDRAEDGADGSGVDVIKNDAGNGADEGHEADAANEADDMRDENHGSVDPSTLYDEQAQDEQAQAEQAQADALQLDAAHA
jgi:type III secretion protein L